MSEEKRKLTFWQKIENFWYYYKWRILVAVVFIVAIYIGTQVMSDNTKNIDADLRIVSVFAHPLTSEEYNIDKKLQNTIEDIDNDKTKTVILKPYYITEDREGDENLVAEAQVNENFKNAQGDLLIFDAPNLAYYLKKDIFAPIGDFVDLSFLPKEDIIYQNDVAVAIKLSDSKILRDMNFIIDEVYVSVLFIPDNADEALLKSRKNTTPAIIELLKK